MAQQGNPSHCGGRRCEGRENHDAGIPQCPLLKKTHATVKTRHPTVRVVCACLSIGRGAIQSDRRGTLYGCTRLPLQGVNSTRESTTRQCLFLLAGAGTPNLGRSRIRAANVGNVDETLAPGAGTSVHRHAEEMAEVSATTWYIRLMQLVTYSVSCGKEDSYKQDPQDCPSRPLCSDRPRPYPRPNQGIDRDGRHCPQKVLAPVDQAVQKGARSTPTNP